MARRPRGELRIIGGDWRSRRVVFAQEQVRPTPDRVRQTTFDWLTPHIRGAHVVDLCAGSGAMGLEALSRGAAHVTFVDAGRTQIAAIGSALESLGGKGRARLVQQDAAAFLAAGVPLATAGAAFDLAFVDPPFDADLWHRLLPALQPWMSPKHRVYIEWPRAAEPDFGVALEWLKTSRAAQVSYGLARFGDAQPCP